MKKYLPTHLLTSKTILFLFLMVTFLGNAQIMRVKIKGGAVVTHESTITITSGNKIKFEITNIQTGNCKSVNVKSIELSPISTDFSISPSDPDDRSENIKPDNCNGEDELEFEVKALGTACGTTTTLVTIKSNLVDFSFYVTVVKAPVISVLGGSPLADINNGSILPSSTTGTTFGIVEVVGAVNSTRTYTIINTGSCILNIGSITINEYIPSPGVGDTGINSTEFSKVYLLPSSNIDPGTGALLKVKFDPTSPGIKYAIISIPNNAGGNYTFVISGEGFGSTVVGPGGFSADFRLWLKTTRGVTSSSTKVSDWKDLGSTGKDASQVTVANRPTYYDELGKNINFNPVIKFENGVSNQFMENKDNGFYSQEIFIVMKREPIVSGTHPAMTILSGTVSNSINSIGASVPGNVNYDNDGDTSMNDVDVSDLNLTNDVTGIGFGDFTTRLSGERLWYNQGSSTTNPYYSVEGLNTRTYDNAGIINVQNKTVGVPADGMTLFYNSINDSNVPVSNLASYDNLGYNNSGIWVGTPYNIGKNYNETNGSFNGSVAEILTYATRLTESNRNKVETYLAIKYAITLGETEASKNYINSNSDVIWNYSANIGFNFNVAGIGRDDASDLNQKQSKSINEDNEVAIYLGNVFTTNSANTNEFSATRDFLVWGCNNGTYTANGTNDVTIGSGLSSTITKIDRKWKIVESGGDVGNTFVSIPKNAFDLSLANVYPDIDEEYVLIVYHNEDFDNEYFEDEDIVDVIPLKLDAGNTNYQTWYDFDGTKFFTFGKAPKLSGNRSVNIASGDYLVGEYALNLNINAFTISAWVKSAPSASTRTIMAKGSKLQLRLNGANKIEVMLDNDIAPRFTSAMMLNDNSKWHHITFVYDNGSIFLYIDGVLDKSEQNINPPSPNYNRFSVGALYIAKNNIINPFLGELDEIYVWDQGLTEDQVRYLMNQEAEKITGNFINGKTLPQASPSNEITNIPWSTLRTYYDFNSFYGSTVEGLTDARNFLRLKYLNKIKTIVGTQTAPLPYVSAADGVWGTASTWVNSLVQNPPNSIGLDGSTYIDWNIVETSHNITSGDRDITVLGLKNNSGKITISKPLPTPQDEMNSGHALRVTHYLELDGSIDLVGESQLIQDEGSTLDQDSGGFIERDQQGTANSFNYNYWSSSLGPISGNSSTRGTGVASTNASASIFGVLLDGTTSSTPNSISFNASHTWADNAYAGAKRISTYWFYKFNGLHDDYNSWFPRINENSPLFPGEGYTMKGTSGNVTITTNQNYVFKGKPYNGDISLTIAAGNDRLIGNPYPSALDANEFILDNIKTTEIFNEDTGRNTVNVFNGALYFWHHFGEVNSHILKEYVGGYATYTLMGGTQAYSTDARINNSTPLIGGGKVPERYIPVGQGFFVNATLPSGISGTTATVDGGSILFKNSQRVFERENTTATNDGSVFFKTNSVSKTKITKTKTDARPKIRLQFSSPKGYQRQLLIGVDKNATNNFDLGYDAPIADINKEDMFWTFDGAKFVIQAVNNFNTDQELPLGVIIAKAGLATIKIDELENLDENISLHIKDKLTGETHNISKKAFEINLEAGQYLDRFVLIFKMQKIVTEDVAAEVLIVKEQIIVEGIHVFMDNTIGELQIKNNSVEEILSIEFYNYLGQRIKNWNTNLNRKTISLPINSATGVYIVQINTKTGKTVKKINVE